MYVLIFIYFQGLASEIGRMTDRQTDRAAAGRMGVRAFVRSIGIEQICSPVERDRGKKSN